MRYLSIREVPKLGYCLQIGPQAKGVAENRLSTRRLKQTMVYKLSTMEILHQTCSGFINKYKGSLIDLEVPVRIVDGVRSGGLS